MGLLHWLILHKWRHCHRSFLSGNFAQAMKYLVSSIVNGHMPSYIIIYHQIPLYISYNIIHVYIYIYCKYCVYHLVISHSHGKSPCLMGKPSISMGHGNSIVSRRNMKSILPGSSAAGFFRRPPSVPGTSPAPPGESSDDGPESHGKVLGGSPQFASGE